MNLPDDEAADLRIAHNTGWLTLLAHVADLCDAYRAQGYVMGDLAHDGTLKAQAEAESDDLSCGAAYGSNPDRCYHEAGHPGAHSNRWGTTWVTQAEAAVVDGWICEVCGCWNRDGDLCKYGDDEAHQVEEQ